MAKTSEDGDTGADKKAKKPAAKTPAAKKPPAAKKAPAAAKGKKPAADKKGSAKKPKKTETVVVEAPETVDVEVREAGGGHVDDIEDAEVIAETPVEAAGVEGDGDLPDLPALTAEEQ